MEVGVRLRFNRTVSGWPGRPGELVERDRADVIVTTDLDPLIVTAVPGGEDYTEDLKKISVPVLAMNGDGD